MPVDVARARNAGRPRAEGALGAAEACREVITAYFHLSDADDLDGLAGLLTEDVVLGHAPTTVTGRAAVVDLLRSRRRSSTGRRTLHLLGNVQMLDIGEREASSYAVLAFYDWQHADGAEAEPRLVGHFESHDRYALGEDGRWRISHHRAVPVG